MSIESLQTRAERRLIDVRDFGGTCDFEATQSAIQDLGGIALELLEALDDMSKWVDAFAYGQGANQYAEVMRSPRMVKAREVIAKAEGK